MTIKVCVAGATGWAGSELARSIATAPDLALVAAVARTHAGRILGDVLGEPAARLIPQWEITDYAHDDKVDAPSGTVRELAYGSPKCARPSPRSLLPRWSARARLAA